MSQSLSFLHHSDGVRVVADVNGAVYGVAAALAGPVGVRVAAVVDQDAVGPVALLVLVDLLVGPEVVKLAYCRDSIAPIHEDTGKEEKKSRNISTAIEMLSRARLREKYPQKLRELT